MINRLRDNRHIDRRPCSYIDSCNVVGKGAVVFCWVAIPYRMEWRHSILSNKFIALEAGHICQNLYLACEAINAGTCAIGYYNQDKVDEFLDVDGKNEITIYVAPVGKATNF